MLTAILTLSILALAFGLLLGYSSLRFHVEGDPIVDKVDALLPQTQCGQCGYPGCKPYAEAITLGEVEINKCVPGGEPVIIALADLLGRDPVAMDESAVEKVPAVALIDEASCIGCTLCLQACPVDAIVGAAKQMHTIIEKECTGCELCLPPCPVDCIHMRPLGVDAQHWIWPFPDSRHRVISQPDVMEDVA